VSIVVCPACGAKNRVDEQAVDRRPVCGKCGTRLPVAGQAAPNKPITVTDESFAHDVLEAGRTPVLLDAWAPWCGPCRMIAPALEQLAAESDGQYRVAKLNVDENPGIARQFHIDSIPTMLLFKNGQLVDRIVGLQPKAALAAKLKQHV
jgi:thioredoxin